MRVIVIFCLAVIVLGTQAQDDHFRVGTGGSTDDGMKKGVDDLEDVHRGIQRPDDPKPVIYPGQAKPHLKPVNLKPELENKNMGKGTGRKNRLTKKRKLTLKRLSKRPNQRQFRPKRPTQKKSNKRVLVRVNSKRGRKNRKPIVWKNVKPRNKKRQLRKLHPRYRQTIVDRIVEDHNKGKASSVSTAYLQNRIRAMLEQQGFVTLPKCKGKNKRKKINQRKRILRKNIIANRINRKQPRTLKPRLVIKNKNVPKKVKKTKKNKVGKVKIVKTNLKKNKNNRNRKTVVVKKMKNGRYRKNKGKGVNNKKVKKPRTNRKPKAKGNKLNAV